MRVIGFPLPHIQNLQAVHGSPIPLLPFRSTQALPALYLPPKSNRNVHISTHTHEPHKHHLYPSIILGNSEDISNEEFAHRCTILYSNGYRTHYNWLNNIQYKDNIVYETNKGLYGKQIVKPEAIFNVFTALKYATLNGYPSINSLNRLPMKVIYSKTGTTTLSNYYSIVFTRDFIIFASLNSKHGSLYRKALPSDTLLFINNILRKIPNYDYGEIRGMSLSEILKIPNSLNTSYIIDTYGKPISIMCSSFQNSLSITSYNEINNIDEFYNLIQ